MTNQQIAAMIIGPALGAVVWWRLARRPPPGLPPDLREVAARAKSERDAGNLAVSLKIYQSLMKKERKNVHHRYFAGTVCMYQGEYRDACCYFKQALSIVPEHTASKQRLQECEEKVRSSC